MLSCFWYLAGAEITWGAYRQPVFGHLVLVPSGILPAVLLLFKLRTGGWRSSSDILFSRPRQTARWGTEMKFGVWYGMAMWFLILKGLDVAPFAEWSWWFVLLLVAWPNLLEIKAFLLQQGERLALYVRTR